MLRYIKWILPYSQNNYFYLLNTEKVFFSHMSEDVPHPSLFLSKQYQFIHMSYCYYLFKSLWFTPIHYFIFLQIFPKFIHFFIYLLLVGFLRTVSLFLSSRTWCKAPYNAISSLNLCSPIELPGLMVCTCKCKVQ